MQSKHEALPAAYFAKDTVFVVGGKRFETFYPGPGHTSDNIVVWLPEDKILYGGCFIKSTDNSSLGNVADANVPEWPRSVRRLMRKFRNPQYVIPGHFSWIGKYSIQHTLKLLRSAK